MRFGQSASALLKDYLCPNGEISEFRRLFRDVAGRVEIVGYRQIAKCLTGLRPRNDGTRLF
jgi:hypothetical protein